MGLKKDESKYVYLFETGGYMKDMVGVWDSTEDLAEARKWKTRADAFNYVRKHRKELWDGKMVALKDLVSDI